MSENQYIFTYENDEPKNRKAKYTSNIKNIYKKVGCNDISIQTIRDRKSKAYQSSVTPYNDDEHLGMLHTLEYLSTLASNNKPYCELEYEQVGETNYWALVDDKLYSFSDKDELFKAITNTKHSPEKDFYDDLAVNNSLLIKMHIKKKTNLNKLQKSLELIKNKYSESTANNLKQTVQSLLAEHSWTQNFDFPNSDEHEGSMEMFKYLTYVNKEGKNLYFGFNFDTSYNLISYPKEDIDWGHFYLNTPDESTKKVLATIDCLYNANGAEGLKGKYIPNNLKSNESCLIIFTMSEFQQWAPYHETGVIPYQIWPN